MESLDAQWESQAGDSWADTRPQLWCTLKPRHFPPTLRGADGTARGLRPAGPMHVGGGWTCWGRASDAKGGGVWLSLVLASPSLLDFCFLLATHSPTQQVLWTARCGSGGQPWANQNPLLGTSLAVQ